VATDIGVLLVDSADYGSAEVERRPRIEQTFDRTSIRMSTSGV
jgi:hypothetical protein